MNAYRSRAGGDFEREFEYATARGPSVKLQSLVRAFNIRV